MEDRQTVEIDIQLHHKQAEPGKLRQDILHSVPTMKVVLVSVVVIRITTGL